VHCGIPLNRRAWARTSGIVILVFCISQNAASRIREVDVTVGISASADRIDVEIPIYDEGGIQKYFFVCHGGEAEYLAALTKANHVWYVAPLMCLLTEGNVESEGSLLAEDAVPPWHTRGQFHWEELTGPCGDYPEFGRVRHFRLQQMVLTLEAREVELKDGQLDHFKLRVSVKNDGSATSLTAVRPGYLWPRGDCKVIRRGSEPRMCRNSVGSYEVCPD
jgi:hypothetical protein